MRQLINRSHTCSVLSDEIDDLGQCKVFGENGDGTTDGTSGNDPYVEEMVG